MAEIKPVQFPSLNHEVGQTAKRPSPIQKGGKMEPSPLQQIFANGFKARGASPRKVNRENSVAATGSNNAKIQKLKFYQPTKNIVRETAQLGQIIDVKA